MPIIFATLIAFLLSFIFPQHVLAASQILINEFLVEPDNDQEIELYNASDTQTDISGYFLDDDSGSQKYTIPSGTILGSGEIKSFKSSSFNLNRASQDIVRLLNGENILDSKAYDKSPGSSKSFGRAQDGSDTWLVFGTHSLGKSNNESIGQPIASPSPTPTPSSTKPTTSPQVTLQTKSPSPVAVPSISIKSPFVTGSTLTKSSPVVLGETNTQSTSSATPLAESPSPNSSPEVSKSQSTKVAASLAGGGLIMVAAAIGLFLWYKGKEGRKEENTDE